VGIFAIIIVLSVTGFEVAGWLRSRNNEVRILQIYTVNLPDGDSLTYKSQALPQAIIGPSDSQKLLVWKRKNGQSQTYPISAIGAGYGEIEFRIRADGKAVWLIDWMDKKVAATLDLATTRFATDGCVMYWGYTGCSDSESPGKPKWATLTGGKSLGRKRF
jgi:hypothetical protein